MRGARVLLLCAAAILGLAAPAMTEAAADGRVIVRSKITSFSAVSGRLLGEWQADGKRLRRRRDGAETARVRPSNHAASPDAL